MILVLVARVVGGEMPFALINRLGDGQRDGAVLLVGVSNVRLVEDYAKKKTRPLDYTPQAAVGLFLHP